MAKLKIDIRLSQKQAEFLRAPQRIKGFCGGQGAGKSFIGSYDMLSRVKSGRVYTVVAPSYPMLRDSTFRSFRQVAELTRQWESIRWSDFIATVRCPTGGSAEVLFRSADDPERLRGPNLSGAWLDEASLCDRAAWQILAARLREGGEQGFISATFTAKGRGHWTYEVFGKGNPDVHLTQAATADNPFLDAGFLEMVHSQYTGLRREQELGGKFVSIEGSEWPGELFESPQLWFDEWPWDLQVRAIGVDPSKGRSSKSGDYAAIVLLGVDREGTIYLEGDLRRGLDADSIVDAVIEHSRLFMPDAVAWETNLFASLFLNLLDRRCRELGVMVPAYGVDNRIAKEIRIRRLTPYLTRHQVRFRKTPGTELLVDQFREFPEGECDDGPDSAEMALRAAGAVFNGRMRAERQQGEVVFIA